MMKALIQNEFGDSNVLKYTDVVKPVLGEGEVLIRTAFTSVNFADIKNRTGKKDKGNFPMVLGLDIAGTIEEVGENSSFSKGDRVIAFPKNGSYAEYVVATEALVYKIPDALSFEIAATFPTVAILSYILIHEIGQVREKDTVVIHSAAGGVGSMLVQLAKLAKVKRIIGVVGNFDKEAYVKELGADVVTTYDTFVETVLNLTDGEGANVIFDSVAGDLTSQSMECLAFYGTLVQFGNSSGKAGHFKTSDVHSSCRNVKGFSLGTTRKHHPERLKSVAEKVCKLFEEDLLKLPIARIFELCDAPKAHDLMESRQYQGKILLKV